MNEDVGEDHHALALGRRRLRMALRRESGRRKSEGSYPKRCKGVHFVDLGESFPTSIYLQKLASIQPRTSPVKLATTLADFADGDLRDSPGLAARAPCEPRPERDCFSTFRDVFS